MSRPSPRTAVGIPLDRYVPATEYVPMMRALDASPDVDGFLMWDQQQWFFPPALWTPENTPLAETHRDPHSFPDVFALGGYLLANAPGLNLTISTDSVRRGPGELLQSLITFADLTGGNAMFHVGAGEVKQTKPFGFKRSQGLGRLEDLLVIRDKLWATDGPVSYQGNHTKLTNAYLGDAKAHRPEIWALGGGPKLLDLATSHADGFATLVPYGWTSPEEAGTAIAAMKADLERKGRDPEAFGFGVWVTPLIHEDPQALEQALTNPIVRFMSAVFGRMNMADWDKVGITPSLPRDWHYATHLLALEMSDEQLRDILENTTPEQVRQSWMMGSPAEVGAELRRYVDAGASYVMVADMMAMTLPDDPAVTLQRTLDVCAAVKAAELPTRRARACRTVT